MLSHIISFPNISCFIADGYLMKIHLQLTRYAITRLLYYVIKMSRQQYALTWGVAHALRLWEIAAISKSISALSLISSIGWPQTFLILVKYTYHNSIALQSPVSSVCVPTFSVPRTFSMAFKYDCVLYCILYTVVYSMMFNKRHTLYNNI